MASDFTTSLMLTLQLVNLLVVLGMNLRSGKAAPLGIHNLIGILIFQIVQNNHLLRIFYCGA